MMNRIAQIMVVSMMVLAPAMGGEGAPPPKQIHSVISELSLKIRQIR
ncbi:MAG: hypothetical protein LBJ92_04935 [Holosporales bacterium]|jgi:hypothetical protein|nr:hypothetical protein [Holosporales bacterium]